jgi:nucleoside-diphosphate-sugar epimerase
MDSMNMRDAVCKSLGLGERRVHFKIPLRIVLLFVWLLSLFSWIIRPLRSFSHSWSWFNVVRANTHQTYDISKAKDILGYSPPFSLTDGLSKTSELFELSQKSVQ